MIWGIDILINIIVTVHRFRVKDKEGIEDPKSSIKMLIVPSNCQFGFKFWISLTKMPLFS